LAKSRFKHQPDLFIADASFVRTKELQPLMATNWFSLNKNPRNTPIIHEYQNYNIKVENPTSKGIATIWDHDVLIFLISQIVSAHNQGDHTSNRIQFTGYEFFQFLRRDWRGGITGQRSYKLLWEALDRLHTTHIQTNVKPHGDIEEAQANFYWLPHIEKLKKRSGDEVGYEVWLDPKLHEWTQNTKNILTLSGDYFDLTSGLARFVYLWARKSVGKLNYNKTWSESFKSLSEKSGSTLKPAQFNQLLRRIIKNNNLPEYILSEEISKRGALLGVKLRTFEELPPITLK
jgi:plasmid replication initiation protein